MSKHQGTSKYLAHLALDRGSTAPSPHVAHQDTLLEALEHALNECRYILATDDHGAIVGVVPVSRISERLQASNLRERLRWAETPLRSLINVLLAGDASTTASMLHDGTECTAIVENGRLVGIAVDQDVFLSWHRLEPMLSSAIADPLTGLMNRLAYERRLREEWYRAERTGCSIAIVVVDLDHFKTINDELGHQAGDAALRRVARLLESSVRSYDVVARYGGDEFVALCLGCRPGEIAIPVRRVLDAFALESRRGEWSLSASVGAAVRHDRFALSSPAELFSAADQCLYDAKAARGVAYAIEFGGESSPQVTPIANEGRLDYQTQGESV